MKGEIHDVFIFLKKRLNLPFFAYDVFKPGQIGYSRIKDFISEEPIKYDVDYALSAINGVPFAFKNRFEQYSTAGYLIKFNEDYAFEAYKRISDAKSYKLYKWEEYNDGKTKMNILVAKRDLIDRKFSQTIYDYDGRKDPMLTESIKTISSNMISIFKKKRNYDNFFNLQANYMLLWSSIDRFLDLRFGNKNQSENLKCLANEKSFQLALFMFGNQNSPSVYSHEDLRSFTLDLSKPLCCIKYYYTIRCNVVHTGKSNGKDYELLKQALFELMVIYIHVLRDAFEDNDLFDDTLKDLKKLKSSVFL